MKRYIVGLGEALWDVLPGGAKLGGAPANFAYHAGQYGLESMAISALGKDALGDQALKEFDEKHVNYIMPQIDFPTGRVDVAVDEAGVPSYKFLDNTAWDNIPFTPEIETVAQNARAVCYGTLAQRSEPSHTNIQRFLDATPADCIRIYDINLRGTFYTKELIQENLRKANVLKINDEELVLIGRMFGYPGLDMENKCWLILGKYNLDMLVLTCGTNGSYVFAPGTSSFQETPIVEVADTVGAGDSFTGSFTAAILSGKTIEEAHRLAVHVSAYVCTQKGVMPQLPEEMVRAIKA